MTWGRTPRVEWLGLLIGVLLTAAATGDLFGQVKVVTLTSPDSSFTLLVDGVTIVNPVKIEKPSAWVVEEWKRLLECTQQKPHHPWGDIEILVASKVVDYDAKHRLYYHNWGMTLWEFRPGKTVIVIEANDRPDIRRATLSHEFMHAIYGPNKSEGFVGEHRCTAPWPEEADPNG